MTNEINREIIYPRVAVYKNLLPDVDDLLSIVKETEADGAIKEGHVFSPWRNWYGFGIMSDSPMLDEGKDYTYYDNEDPLNIKQKQFVKRISDAFFTATNHFIEEWGVELPNWKHSGLSINKYDETPEQNELAMTYHMDYAAAQAEEPGNKFGITCTVYLNDNYDGGEVSFLHVEEHDVIDYKPVAGDLVVFPSGEPYFHGVKSISNGNKYLIRTFWQWEYPGSEEWLANQEKYGQEEWAKLWKEKFVAEYKSGKYHKYLVFQGEEHVEQEGATPFFVKKPRP